MSTEIKKLKDENGNVIIPETLTKATFDEKGNRLDNILNGCAYLGGEAEPSVPTPRDADTLEGHPSSYFAKASDIPKMVMFEQTITFSASSTQDKTVNFPQTYNSAPFMVIPIVEPSGDGFISGVENITEKSCVVRAVKLNTTKTVRFLLLWN